jgi:succinyl-CoA synthetase alpha subunit
MTATDAAVFTRDLYYYHGHTVVEQVRCGGGEVLWRHWHLFDTVEDAQRFYFSSDGADGRGGVS